MTSNEVNDTPWPPPTFSFEVDFAPGLQRVPFMHVSGLDDETQDYRTSPGTNYPDIKRPKIVKYNNASLKKGAFVNNQAFWNWQNQIATNTIAPSIIVIRLLDATHTVKMTWTLNNAWPTKILGNDLKSDGNELAVQGVELVYQQVTATTP